MTQRQGIRSKDKSESSPQTVLTTTLNSFRLIFLIFHDGIVTLTSLGYCGKSEKQI